MLAAAVGLGGGEAGLGGAGGAQLRLTPAPPCHRVPCPPHPTHPPPAAAGFVRVYLTSGSTTNSAAIAASLFFIVLSSVLVGSALPFGLARLGVDPANAGTSVQVIMDVLGCAVTCVTCQFVLGQLAGAVGGG